MPLGTMAGEGSELRMHQADSNDRIEQTIADEVCPSDCTLDGRRTCFFTNLCESLMVFLWTIRYSICQEIRYAGTRIVSNAAGNNQRASTTYAT